MLVFVLPFRCLRSGNVPAGLSTSCTIAREVIASTSSYTAGSSSYSAWMRCVGLFGDVRVGREHHRDRLADVAHLVESEDRLVVERRAVIGFGNDLQNVAGSDDVVNPGEGLRGTRRQCA